MYVALQHRKGPASANVFAAFRAHTWIRHEEHVDPDDLILEGSKWWEPGDRFDPVMGVLSAKFSPEERHDGAPEGRTVPDKGALPASGPNLGGTP